MPSDFDKEPRVRVPKRLRRAHNGVTHVRELYPDMRDHYWARQTKAPRKHSLRDHRKG
jgi:hypothetical protein